MTTWKVGASGDLPIAASDAAWDGPAALKRMLDAGPDTARRGCLLYDSDADPKTQAAYKDPFANLDSGSLKAIPSGLRAAASRLPQTDAPQAAIDQARKILDGYFSKMKKQTKGNPLYAAWEKFRDTFSLQVSRDMAMMNIGQQVCAMLDQQNMANPEDYNSYHFLQDLYTAEDGSLYAISISGGSLYRWSITIDQNNNITLGTPSEVKPTFLPTSDTGTDVQNQTLRIHRTPSGGYAGFAIMGTAALNKDGEIDSRALFDCFVDRFNGTREYINIYHLGRDATRIGSIKKIFREGNLLIGYYELDDNPVANAAGATLAADTDGYWGGSIEFLSDDPGTKTQVAADIEAKVYERGTFLGFSIAKTVHGAAWSTGHFLTRTPDMNEQFLAAIDELLGDNEVAKTQFKGWVEAADLRVAAGITRTAKTEESVVVEQVEEVTQAAGDAAPASDTTPADSSQIVVDDQLLQAVVKALSESDFFKSVVDSESQMSDRLAALEESVAKLQGTGADAQPADATPVGQTVSEQVAASTQPFEQRLAAMEQVIGALSAFYDRSKPQVVQTATYRPGSNVPVQAHAAPPPVTPAVPASLKSQWKRPTKIAVGKQ